MGKLYAISDLHLSHKFNLEAFNEFFARPAVDTSPASKLYGKQDGLIIAGDVTEKAADLRHCFDITTQIFGTVWWVPGNHELYTMPTPAGAGVPDDGSDVSIDKNLRGEAKYDALVEIARSFGVLTPEDEYVSFTYDNPSPAPSAATTPLSSPKLERPALRRRLSSGRTTPTSDPSTDPRYHNPKTSYTSFLSPVDETRDNKVLSGGATSASSTTTPLTTPGAASGTQANPFFHQLPPTSPHLRRPSSTRSTSGYNFPATAILENAAPPSTSQPSSQPSSQPAQSPQVPSPAPATTPPTPTPPTSTRVLICPIFTLYDYSFRPTHISRSAALDWALEEGVQATDEHLLHPDPHPTRDAWCETLLTKFATKLAETSRSQPNTQLVIVNHWPLREDLIWIPAVPRFSLWCGSRLTENWHLKYNACCVVTGHLHVRRTDWKDGVRFEEVSMGYPRQWEGVRKLGRTLADLVREVLPGPWDVPKHRQGETIFRRNG